MAVLTAARPAADRRPLFTQRTTARWVLTIVGWIAGFLLCLPGLVVTQFAIAGAFFRLPGHQAAGAVVLLGTLALLVGLIAAVFVWIKVRPRWFVMAAIAGGLYLLLTIVIGGFLYASKAGPTVVALFVSAEPGYFVIFGIVGLVVGGVLALLRFYKTVTVIVISALITTALSGFVLSRQVAFAHSHDAPLTVQDVLSLGDPAMLPDEQPVFATKEGMDMQAAVWKPAGPTPTTTPSLRPAMVLLHGGGFAAGNRLDMKQNAVFLRSLGYPVFSIDYRLAAQDKPRWRDATADVLTFLQWLTVHGKQYGADATKTVLMGGSAGGMIALNAAYGLAGGTLTPESGATPPRPIAVAGFYPPVTSNVFYNTEFQDVQPVLSWYTGGSPTDKPAEWAYADPSTRIAPGLPPTFLMTGEHDHLVYVDQAREFTTKVRAAGTDIEFYPVPFADHAFDIRYHSPNSATQRALLTRWLAKVAPLP